METGLSGDDIVAVNTFSVALSRLCIMILTQWSVSYDQSALLAVFHNCEVQKRICLLTALNGMILLVGNPYVLRAVRTINLSLQSTV